MSVNTPVVLIVFNRPSCTRAVLNALAEVRPKTLYVIADGPREDVKDDLVNCAEVRALFTSIPWDCKVITNFSDVNLGCRNRCISGLDWVFSQTEMAIVLEDDTVPEASFFPYCEVLLEQYRDDEWVQLIRGYCGVSGQLTDDSSYYFSRWQSTWGWASWARSWRLLDMDMKQWPALRQSNWLAGLFTDQEMVKVFDYLFEGSYNGSITDWGNQWFLSGWLNNSVTIAPTRNMIRNIGFGEDATHLKNTLDPNANLPTFPMTFPLRHPVRREIWHEADNLEWKMAYIGLRKKLRFSSKFKSHIRQLINLVKPPM